VFDLHALGQWALYCHGHGVTSSLGVPLLLLHQTVFHLVSSNEWCVGEDRHKLSEGVYHGSHFMDSENGHNFSFGEDLSQFLALICFMHVPTRSCKHSTCIITIYAPTRSNLMSPLLVHWHGIKPDTSLSCWHEKL
jgi:hypothetical protein